MKRLLYMLVSLAALAIFGFTIVSSTQGNSRQPASENFVVPTSVPTELAGFPDIDHVPIYPHASIAIASITFNGYVTPITSIGPNDISRYASDGRHIGYEVADSLDKVSAFYRNVLPKEGWLLQDTGKAFDLYSWTDPAQLLPWHLYLKVRLGLAVDNLKTEVGLEYGRYPAIEAGLSTYPDARKVVTSKSNIEETLPTGKLPEQITDVSYVSSASPKQIADFYNGTMVKYGWSFFDRSGAGEVKAQTGDISSAEGLFFRATRTSWHAQTIVSYQLFVTARVQKDGQVAVKLHSVTLEMPSGGG